MMVNDFMTRLIYVSVFVNIFHLSYCDLVTQHGRLFATMLGYPARCSLGESQHSCTLSLACWLVGGKSESGCGTSPWLVACCVKPSQRLQQLQKEKISASQDNHGQLLSLDNNDLISIKIPQNDIDIEGFDELQTPELPPSVLQRRADDFDDLDSDCGVSAEHRSLPLLILGRTSRRRSSRGRTGRIIGGQPAKFAQFPWQAHIRIGQYQCGGVLVSRSFVATAAHCIVRAKLSEIVVYLGELDTQDTGQVIELAPAEHHRVIRKILHPSFQLRDTQPDRYDLALLQLASSARRMYHISPVCLPQSGLKVEGLSGVVAGWGKVKPSTELTGTNVLRSAVVPILDTEECIRWHDSKQIRVELGAEMICAGHAAGGRDACLGDSGGPLIVPISGKWTLAGITSAGFGCGEPKQPGIYHNVAVTTQWIRDVITNTV